MSLELAALLVVLAGALWGALSKRIDRVEKRFDKRFGDVEQQLNQGRLFVVDPRHLKAAGIGDRPQRYLQKEDDTE